MAAGFDQSFCLGASDIFMSPFFVGDYLKSEHG
jgi:hypothetical protein